MLNRQHVIELHSVDLAPVLVRARDLPDQNPGLADRIPLRRPGRAALVEDLDGLRRAGKRSEAQAK